MVAKLLPPRASSAAHPLSPCSLAGIYFIYRAAWMFTVLPAFGRQGP